MDDYYNKRLTTPGYNTERRRGAKADRDVAKNCEKRHLVWAYGH